jgi:hypothetical protein
MLIISIYKKMSIFYNTKKEIIFKYRIVYIVLKVDSFSTSPFYFICFFVHNIKSIISEKTALMWSFLFYLNLNIKKES